MLVDGKKIAETLLSEIKKEVASFKQAPRLSIITSAPNFETQKYLLMKKEKAKSVGIDLNIVELSERTTTLETTLCITQVARASDGVVVQLPLPPQVDRDAVLRTIAPSKDPDGFQYGKVKGVCMSPVVGAIDEISKHYEVDWLDKKVVVLGMGRLVGVPATYYAKEKGAEVLSLTKDNYNENSLKEADIIISGIGKPNFIKPNMVKDGVVIFDAGTSEDGGQLVGDVAKELVSKASLLTPVPGGIGPITIAYLLRNLLQLARQ